MPALLVLPSSPYGIVGVRILLPQTLSRGALLRFSRGPYPPYTASLSVQPVPQPAAGSCCCPQPLPRGLSKGWQRSAPAQVIWPCPRPIPSGRLHLHGASAQRLPAVVCRAPGAQPPSCVCGRENSLGKRCWDITMETASLHRAASVCMAKGCPHPLAASVVLT